MYTRTRHGCLVWLAIYKYTTIFPPGRKNFMDGVVSYCVFYLFSREGIRREIEVSRCFFKEFWRLKNIERKMTRWNERHIEKFEQTEETLREKMLKQPKSLEDEMFDSERDKQLRLAIQQLPEVQRRRFVLHHEFGLTYEQIGQVENRHLTSIRESVLAAEGKIKKILKDFEN